MSEQFNVGDKVIEKSNNTIHEVTEIVGDKVFKLDGMWGGHIMEHYRLATIDEPKTLNETLKALGYTVEPHSERKEDCCGYIKLKSILLNGEVKHCGNAHSTWEWLEKTGQV